MQNIEGASATPNSKDSQGSMRWTTLPDRATVERTISALGQRNIHAQSAGDEKEALARLVDLIPAGADVMTGASRTLDQIGFTDMLKSGEHRWKNVKAEMLAEPDPVKQLELRERATLSEYFVGSAQAVTQAGEVVIASASGSQISAYAYGAKNMIWVVGTQKIVPTLEDALRRVREYTLPLEDQRMKSLGYPGSFLGKTLIFEKEGSQRGRKIYLIFVEKPLGF
jgi:hypothetical protein